MSDYLLNKEVHIFLKNKFHYCGILKEMDDKILILEEPTGTQIISRDEVSLIKVKKTGATNGTELSD